MQKIDDLYPVSTASPTAEREKSTDADLEVRFLEVPVVSTTVSSGEEEQWAPLPAYPASRVVGVQLQKIDDFCPVSTASLTAELENTADTDPDLEVTELGVPAVSTTISSGEEQPSPVPASSMAVPSSTQSLLPEEKHVSRQSRDGAARRAWLSKVTFKIFHSWAFAFTGSVLILLMYSCAGVTFIP